MTMKDDIIAEMIKQQVGFTPGRIPNRAASVENTPSWFGETRDDKPVPMRRVELKSREIPLTPEAKLMLGINRDEPSKTVFGTAFVVSPTMPDDHVENTRDGDPEVKLK